MEKNLDFWEKNQNSCSDVRGPEGGLTTFKKKKQNMH